MLQSLRVNNLAIVQDAELTLEAGLNVITGETGAGKSIVAGALTLLLGARADKSLIRTGEDSCTAEAVFALQAPSIIDAILTGVGLAPCEDGVLVLRRTLSANGAGRIWVNDQSTTAQTLKHIGTHLVDMHGPHDHQSLLDQGFQRELLDAFGQTQKLRDAYSKPYIELQQVRNAIAALQGDDKDILQQQDMLSFQLEEIESAELDGLDEDELRAEHTASANAQTVFELANEIELALTEGEQCAFERSTQARSRFDSLASMLGDAEQWRAEAESICIQIQELCASMTARVQRIEADPQRMQWLDDRLTLVHRLKQKYGATLDGVRAHALTLREKLTELESREDRLAELTAQEAALLGQLTKRGAALSQARKSAAGALADAISQHLRDLGFKHGKFSVETLPLELPHPSGCDEIEFGFAPNVGEESRPLRLIASSGEISRVMLAIKAVLALHDRIPVLFFDEIDANVGGEIGNAVGEKMLAVAQSHQVICITHLPQVAVFGQHHLVVSKAVKGKRTLTEIRIVSAEDRKEEIARMLGGRDLTQVTLQHAQEMLERCS